MNQPHISFFDISFMDTLAGRESLIHGLDPRIKTVTTFLFIGIVLSFGKYAISGLIPFFVFPAILIALGNLPFGYIFKKMLLAAPFAVCIGVFNPIMDRHTMVQVGSLGISGGWISFASIMIRFFLTVSAALILIATTGFNGICMALEKMAVPRAFVIQLQFLYRYVFVLVDEAARLSRARSLRSVGSRGLGLKPFAFLLGQLLLRTLDRAQRIHVAMLCRGFDGQIRLVNPLSIRAWDWIFLLACAAAFLFLRFYDLTERLGRIGMGVFS